MQHQRPNMVVQSSKPQNTSNEIKTFDKSMAENLKAALLFSQWQRQK